MQGHHAPQVLVGLGSVSLGLRLLRRDRVGMNPEDERYFRSMRTRAIKRTEAELMALFCIHFKLKTPKGYHAEGELVCPRKGIVCDAWNKRKGAWKCSWID